MYTHSFYIVHNTGFEDATHIRHITWLQLHHDFNWLVHYTVNWGNPWQTWLSPSRAEINRIVVMSALQHIVKQVVTAFSACKAANIYKENARFNQKCKNLIVNC